MKCLGDVEVCGKHSVPQRPRLNKILIIVHGTVVNSCHLRVWEQPRQIEPEDWGLGMMLNKPENGNRPLLSHAVTPVVIQELDSGSNIVGIVAELVL
ncbi:MAG: hypothetical protein JO336_13675 [Acidobacteriia bacterium]|nr:hypothetical protein [Terriglobia bacterium]